MVDLLSEDTLKLFLQILDENTLNKLTIESSRIRVLLVSLEVSSEFNLKQYIRSNQHPLLARFDPSEYDPHRSGEIVQILGEGL